VNRKNREEINVKRKTDETESIVIFEPDGSLSDWVERIQIGGNTIEADANHLPLLTCPVHLYGAGSH